jgi:hypothetical protein
MRTRIITAFLVAMGCVLLSGSAMAQMAVNPVSENQWNRYLEKHPNVQAGMVNDPNYLAKHPGIGDWLHQHPDVAAYQRQQSQNGGWDTHNQYHERNWWQSHDPSWVQTHHPEWAQNHPNYMNNPNYASNPNYGHPGHEGDYDSAHHWHDRSWWVEHNHPWVAQHHPNWVKH